MLEDSHSASGSLEDSRSFLVYYSFLIRFHYTYNARPSRPLCFPLTLSLVARNPFQLRSEMVESDQDYSIKTTNMTKITRATVKSFIKKNFDNLYINRKSRFDGSVDCVMPVKEDSKRCVLPTGMKSTLWELKVLGLWVIQEILSRNMRKRGIRESRCTTVAVHLFSQ